MKIINNQYEFECKYLMTSQSVSQYELECKYLMTSQSVNMSWSVNT